jgi:hypothetical protein
MKLYVVNSDATQNGLFNYLKKSNLKKNEKYWIDGEKDRKSVWIVNGKAIFKGAVLNPLTANDNKCKFLAVENVNQPILGCGTVAQVFSAICEYNKDA